MLRKAGADPNVRVVEPPMDRIETTTPLSIAIERIIFPSFRR